MQPHATRADYERALEDLHFPAAKAAILRHAEDHGGVDAEVQMMLADLPDGVSYESAADLLDAIRDLYARSGVPASAIPV